MGYLEVKYINMVSPRLLRFGWKKKNLATCRCPVCGDSKTSKSKTRFYFYERKTDWFVKCHNCDFSATLRRFLKDFDHTVYAQYTMEKYRETAGRTEREDLAEVVPPKVRTPSPRAKRTVDLPSIDSLPPDHRAVDYVRHRLIPRDRWSRLYYAEDFAAFAATIDDEKEVVSEPRLVIPMVRNGVLEGATGRSLEENPKVRYITVKRDPDQFRLWFGMDEIDPTEKVYITEGSIDSLFLPNAIAMNGLGKVEVPKEVKQPVFVLDNEPRNREIVAVMNALVEAKHLVCVWSDRIRQKDINGMVLSGMKIEEVRGVIDENTVGGLAAKLRIARWQKIGSDAVESRWARR